MDGFSAFLGCIYAGLIIGVLFDLFRALHLLLKRRWLHALFDALFYALSGAFAALTLLYLNGGVLRLYLFVGFFVGIFAYQYSLSVLLRALFTKK